MNVALRFVAGDLDSDDVQDLLRAHLALAFANSPADSVHALDLSGLRDPAVTLWAVRGHDNELIGMGALKSLDAGHAEIKSMRVAAPFLGRGFGRAILDRLVSEARVRGMTRVSLETGGNERYLPARTMYERGGFQPCEAFGGYVPGEFTRCYSLEL